MKSQLSLVLGALLLASALAACDHSKAASSDATGTGPNAQAHAVEVQANPVVTKTVPLYLEMSGILEADRRTDLTANATGQVERTLVEIGQRVQAGDVIAKLDARSVQLSAAEAKANEKSAAEQVATAKVECERYEKLLAKGAVTQQEYDRAAAQCRTQDAMQAVASARAAIVTKGLRDANIRAPFAGVISARFVQTGDYVRPESRVVTLLSDQMLRLRLNVGEAHVAQVREGMKVDFTTVARPDKSYEATVRYLGHEIRSASRDLAVEAVVDNSAGELLPGMFVQAKLVIGEETLPAVPRTAIVPLGDAPTVFAVVDGRLRQRVIQIDPSSDHDTVTVRAGLQAGESIVAKPTNQLVDGAAVR